MFPWFMNDCSWYLFPVFMFRLEVSAPYVRTLWWVEYFLPGLVGGGAGRSRGQRLATFQCQVGNAKKEGLSKCPWRLLRSREKTDRPGCLALYLRD